MIHTFWLNLILITVFQFSMFGFHYPKVDIKKNLYKWTRPMAIILWLTEILINQYTIYPASRGFSLAWLLVFTKSLGWLICGVVGLFTPIKQINYTIDKSCSVLFANGKLRVTSYAWSKILRAESCLGRVLENNVLGLYNHITEFPLMLFMSLLN